MTRMIEFFAYHVRRRLVAYRGRRDARLVRQMNPGLPVCSRLLTECGEPLRPAHEDYTNRISSPDMAASLELASFLNALAEVRGPKRLLDLGSGFSSYVFRRWAAKAGVAVTVFSVDDDPVWLERTRSFLAEHHLDDDNLMVWTEFRDRKEEPFDFIFHDLGDMDLRAEGLPSVIRLMHSQSVVILDDMHKPAYRESVAREVRRAALRLLSLRAYTLDSRGRFAEMMVRGS